MTYKATAGQSPTTLPLSGATSLVMQTLRYRLHRIATGCYLMADIDHVHNEASIMMKHTLHFHDVQLLVADAEKDSLVAIYTVAVAKAKRTMKDNTS